jgi:hypothetical protein
MWQGNRETTEHNCAYGERIRTCRNSNLVASYIDLIGLEEPAYFLWVSNTFQKKTSRLQHAFYIQRAIHQNTARLLNVGSRLEYHYGWKLKPIYCILASCYIRLTLNICSFVHQYNTLMMIGANWHNRAPASGGEYTITPEDGRVRPKHVDD